MAITPITLKLEGSDLPPKELGQVLVEFHELIAELDSDLSVGREHSLRLQVRDLSKGSYALTAEVEPVADAANIGPDVARALITGATAIEQQGIRPGPYSDTALEHLRALVAPTTNGVSAVRIGAPTLNLTAVMTAKTYGTIQALLGTGYTAVGGLEGMLETVSIHADPYFTVYDALTQEAVHCYFSLSELAKVKDAIGAKVAVRGDIRRDPHGRPSYIRNVRFRILGSGFRTMPEDLAGVLRDSPTNVDRFLNRIRNG